MENLKTIVSYHGACVDGSAAAAVFKSKFKDAKFYPVKSRKHIDIKEKIIEDLQNNENVQLFVVDNPFFVEDFVKTGRRIVVLDHHIGEFDNLSQLAEKYTNLTYIFDNDKSGATLAWQYLYQDKPVPEVLQRIENVDLWRMQDKLKDDLVTTYASMYMDDLDFYQKMIFEMDIEEIYKLAKPALDYRDMLVDYYLRNAQVIKLKIGEHIVKAYNVASIRPVVSQVGNILSEQVGETVVLFKVFGNTVNLSFRSAGDYKPSAVELAQKTNGNGHERAAGGYMSLKEFKESIVIDE